VNILKLLDDLSRELPNCDFMVTCYPQHREPGHVKVLTVAVRGASLKRKTAHLDLKITRMDVERLQNPELVILNSIVSTWKKEGGLP
jgi:hypothetical protein